MKILLLPLLTLCSRAQELTTATLDAGGSLTTGGDVEITGSLGGFGEVITGGDTTARSGFPGQLYDPARVVITPGDATISENTAAAFAAEVFCDDDTLLPATAVEWSVDSFLLDVTPEGFVTAGLLPQDFSATLTASAAGVSGTAALTVFDPDPDNYGLYAGDGLPDSWQTLYFGPDNPDADPAADPDRDGQDNQTEYLSGTEPDDPGSLLRLSFLAEAPPPGARVLTFAPFLSGRTYSLESSAALAAPWLPVAGTPAASGEPGSGQITDAAAVEDRKFYRLRITVP